MFCVGEITSARDGQRALCLDDWLTLAAEHPALVDSRREGIKYGVVGGEPLLTFIWEPNSDNVTGMLSVHRSDVSQAVAERFAREVADRLEAVFVPIGPELDVVQRSIEALDGHLALIVTDVGESLADIECTSAEEGGRVYFLVVDPVTLEHREGLCAVRIEDIHSIRRSEVRVSDVHE